MDILIIRKIKIKMKQDSDGYSEGLQQGRKESSDIIETLKKKLELYTQNVDKENVKGDTLDNSMASEWRCPDA